jgi:hypothetical protein
VRYGIVMVMAVRNFPRPGHLERHAHDLAVTHAAFGDDVFTEMLDVTNGSISVGKVRFGSLADILTSPRHVRFTPNNGRWAAHPSQHLAVSL